MFGLAQNQSSPRVVNIVNSSLQQPKLARWHVAAILVRENGHFVVDEVIYLKDRPQDVDVPLSEYLYAGC